jgi:hypothetical protein
VKTLDGQVVADMLAIGKLCRDIQKASGEVHIVAVVPDGTSWRAKCICGYESELEGSVFDSHTAALLEHLEPRAMATGVPFEIPSPE